MTTAAEVMAGFGILQVPEPARGRALPSHLPAGDRVRAVDIESEEERARARQIIDHLHRVAGRVSRYHTFRPAVGMGIAAPQLGIAYQLAIVRKPYSSHFVELANPLVMAASAQLASEYEGCLSFFDVRGIVRRPISVTVAYDQLEAESATTVFTGVLARSVQHEIDHLNGKLYTDTDRMPPGAEPIPVEDYRANRDPAG